MAQQQEETREGDLRMSLHVIRAADALRTAFDEVVADVVARLGTLGLAPAVSFGVPV